MAVDEALLEAAADEGQCTLRFYRWEEPTLSLGYFQTYDDRWQHAPSSRSAVVRRASGGGAILHDIELTYSFAVPSRHPLATGRLDFYRAVHAALIEALAQWGIEAAMFAESQNRPPSPSTALPKGEGRNAFLCFQRRSPGDVLVGDVKIAGSAQRRCRGAVLQHGSVLLACSAAAPELDGLLELAGKAITPPQLIEAWLTRLAEFVGTWHNGQLSDDEHRHAASLVATKYASSAWTDKRSCDRQSN